jgi:hypothetical protein
MIASLFCWSAFRSLPICRCDAPFIGYQSIKLFTYADCKSDSAGGSCAGAEGSCGCADFS